MLPVLTVAGIIAQQEFAAVFALAGTWELRRAQLIERCLVVGVQEFLDCAHDNHEQKKQQDDPDDHGLHPVAGKERAFLRRVRRLIDQREPEAR